MSLWLPRAPPAVLLRTCSRHPHLLVSVRTYALSSQHSRLPLHPLYAYSYTKRSSGSGPSLERHLQSSSSQNDASPASGDKPLPPAPKEDAPLATRVWKKVKHEVQHYWHGSKLLAAEVRISARLQWKLLHGESLTRRERRQVRSMSQSAGDAPLMPGVAEADDARPVAAHPVRCLCDRSVHGAAHPGRAQGLPERAPVHV